MDLNSDEMKKTVAELKQKHGDLRMLSREGKSIIIRRATEAEFEAYMAAMFDPQRKVLAPRTLLERTCVYPDAAELQSILKAQPGLAYRWGDESSDYSGLTNVASEKKDL